MRFAGNGSKGITEVRFLWLPPIKNKINMIILPTRRRLERRRDALYKNLLKNIHRASVWQVEDIMRKIHTINLRLRTYFDRDEKYETREIFEDKDPFETEYTLIQVEQED